MKVFRRGGFRRLFFRAHLNRPRTRHTGTVAARADRKVHSHQDRTFRLITSSAGPVQLHCQSRPLPPAIPAPQSKEAPPVR